MAEKEFQEQLKTKNAKKSTLKDKYS